MGKKIQLQRGRVEVKIFHDRAMEATDVTLVEDLENEERYVFTGTALCHHRDQFNRKVGRKVAATKLLAQLKEAGYTKEDRAMVFLAICPEYKKKIEVVWV